MADAERHYRQILAVAPRHPDSLHLLGLVRAQAGDLDEALNLIGRATAVAPGFALAHYNLGNVQRRLGRNEDAARSFARVIRLQPDSPGALLNLGVTLRELGRIEEAVRAYEQALALRPDDADAHYNLGVAFQALGRGPDAVLAYRRAVALRPADLDAWTNLGAALCALGRTPDAVEARRQVVDLRPDDRQAHLDFADSLRESGSAAEAAAAYARAAALAPGETDGWVRLAVALQEAGRGEEALAAAERALEINGRCAAAWAIRGGLKTFTVGDPDIRSLATLLASADQDAMPQEDRLDLEFTLGKAFMDIGEADAAMDRLDAGNRLKRAGLTYDVRDDEAEFAEIAAALSAARMRQLAGNGAPSDRPVFIVGMPRSGTTLVEQVLASHCQVYGAGELPVLQATLIERLGPTLTPRARAARLAALTSDDLEAMATTYVAATTALAPGAPRVTDKMPSNFRLAGLIALMLPGARIVHCRRDPLDTCLSCYATRFADGQPFTYDLRELGLYYRAYERLMAHWRAVLAPERFIEVSYEDVVADLEGQARRLVAFCGLPWDESCLTFHRSTRQVRTASVNQVRQPLHGASVGRWKAYGARLGPLLEALGGSSRP
jgi:tetratricopeptide (TPR) repeat protein